MRRSKAGWSYEDLEKLYVEHGFRVRYGGHSVFNHVRFPELRTTVPRSRSLAKVYIRIAITLIDEVKRRTAHEGK